MKIIQNITLFLLLSFGVTASFAQSGFHSINSTDSSHTESVSNIWNSSLQDLMNIGLISTQNKQPFHKKIVINQDKTTSLTKVLNNALPDVTFQTDIIEKQWLKLAINCVINPLTAIHNIENGQILSEEFTIIISEILAEVVVVAAYNQVFLDKQVLTTNVLAVAKATENNLSSMLCDVLARRETEINYINGYINTLGKKFNVSTPVNTALWCEVLKLSHD